MLTNRLTLLSLTLAAALSFATPQSADARGHRGGAAGGGGPLSGRVITDNDRALGGARVIVRFAGAIGPAARAPHSLERSHRTNRRGHFTFRHLPAGRYALTAMKPGFYPRTIFTSTGHPVTLHLAHPVGVHLGPRGAVLPGAEATAAGRRRGKAARAEHPAGAIEPFHPITDPHLPHINGHHSPHAPAATATPAHTGHTPAAPADAAGKKKRK